MMTKSKKKHGSSKASSQRMKMQAQSDEVNQSELPANQSVEELAKEPLASSNGVSKASDDAQNQPVDDILSAELRDELGGNATDVMVIVGSKKKKKANKDQVQVTEKDVQQATKMSKSKRRKLEQLAARKAKEARREELYKSLESHQMAKEHLELMYTTSKLGHKETLRERLKRSIRKQQAGLALTAQDEEELVTKQVVDQPDEDMNDDQEEEEEAKTNNTKANTVAAVGPAKAQETPSRKTKTNNKRKAADKEDSPMEKNQPRSEPKEVEKKTESETEPSTGESSNKKSRKKRRKTKKTVVTVETVQVDGNSAASSRTTSAVEHVQETLMETLQTSQEAPAQTNERATEPAQVNMSDAMARLAALRAKNEARRRQKELDKQTPKPNKDLEQEQETSEKVKYIPQPIVLKTIKELQEMSLAQPIQLKESLVTLQRDPQIQLQRMQLPVCSSEQEIMEAILENSVVILCGETGSGKTTQVPQFLYEAGFGHPDSEYPGIIGVTQPRRVAAVSTAQRVAQEMNVKFGKDGHVGYQIRYDADHVGPQTRVKFMTDGILLREVQQDFLLNKYSIILLDEAHERNVNTDILIGLLSRIAPLRAQIAKEQEQEQEQEQANATTPRPRLTPLKLVIMSATLRVEDFTQNTTLFPLAPPVLKVEARQYPVTIHFNKHTELDDYVQAAFTKVVKIHRKLPEGGVLVFLTGQREILQLCRKLRQRFRKKTLKRLEEGSTRARDHTIKSTRELIEKRQEATATTTAGHKDPLVLREHDDFEEQADLEEAEAFGDEEALYALEEERKKTDGSDSEADQEEEEEDDDDDDEMAVPFVHVLPLYSLLPHDEQMRVFEPPPENHRLIVVATNVAETSLTIPGIKYVVDAGRTKERVFDLQNGISSFEITWVSKASADQRAGRAGRTGPGHCYRLYSSAVFDTEFQKFSQPEILREPIEDLVLQMKAMGIQRIQKFPFPTPPDPSALQSAVTTLVNLGAITTTCSRRDGSSSVSTEDDERITALGRDLVQFPVAARFAKMLLVARRLGVLEYVIAIVAVMSGHSPFVSVLDRKDKEKQDTDQVNDDQDQDSARNQDGKAQTPEDELLAEWKEVQQLRKHAQWIDPQSDVLSLLRAAGAYAFSGASSEFCRDNFLHEKMMQQTLKLRQQLTRIVNDRFAEEEDFAPITLNPRMPPPNEQQQVLLRQIVLVGFMDQVAKRVPPGVITEGSKLERNCGFLASNHKVKEALYIHPHSHVFTADPARLPQFVVFQQIMRTSRAYMKNVTSIDAQWLANVAKSVPSLAKLSSPLPEPAPFYDHLQDEMKCYVKVFFGQHLWELPIVCTSFATLVDHSSLGQSASGSDPAKRNEELMQLWYRHFAKSLLDSQIGPWFAKFFTNFLKEPTSVVIRKKFDKKIQLLVATLQSKSICTRAKLLDEWRHHNPQFLCDELSQWLVSAKQQEFRKQWRELVAQALVEG